MDLSWSQEQTTLFSSIAELAASDAGSTLQERDRNGTFDLAAWRRCGKFGLLGLTVPEQYGGLGLDALTAAGALESFGYGCSDNGLSFSIGAHLFAVTMPIVELGTEEQKQRYLPRLIDGSAIGCNAITEPSSGSDAFSLRTAARRVGDRYVLDGSKVFATNGPVADLYLVFANVDPNRAARGLSAFLVERGAPGLEIGKPTDKLGLRTSPMSELFFDGCEVDASARLGAEGIGAMQFTLAMVWERSFILAPFVGAMRRVLEHCKRHARERKQFGQAIGKFQLVASKIVDMQLRLETARSLLYRTGWLKAKGDTCFTESSLTKLYISEAWLANALDAIQLFGAYGYTEELELARELRDASGSRIFSGTSEIQRVMAGELLLDL